MKLGPCNSKENCASVNGVLERFLTHLLVYSLVVVSESVVVRLVVARVSSKASGDVVSLCLLNLAFEWPFDISS